MSSCASCGHWNAFSGQQLGLCGHPRVPAAGFDVDRVNVDDSGVRRIGASPTLGFHLRTLPSFSCVGFDRVKESA